jgi:methylmalonyl-CoA mutase cobalamin-binding subunit
VSPCLDQVHICASADADRAEAVRTTVTARIPANAGFSAVIGHRRQDGRELLKQAEQENVYTVGKFG